MDGQLTWIRFGVESISEEADVNPRTFLFPFSTKCKLLVCKCLSDINSFFSLSLLQPFGRFPFHFSCSPSLPSSSSSIHSICKTHTRARAHLFYLDTYADDDNTLLFHLFFTKCVTVVNGHVIGVASRRKSPKKERARLFFDKLKKSRTRDEGGKLKRRRKLRETADVGVFRGEKISQC